jgi:hypothetical protein
MPEIMSKLVPMGWRTFLTILIMLIYGWTLSYLHLMTTEAFGIAALAAGLAGVKKWKENGNG